MHGTVAVHTYTYDTVYDIFLRDGIGMISRGRRKSKIGNTGVPTVRTICATAFFCCIGSYTSYVASDDVCLVVALDLKMCRVVVPSPAAVHQPCTHSL